MDRDYSTNELMAAVLARELRDDEIGFVGVGTGGRAFTLVVGIPMVAGRLAQLTHAPHFELQIGPIIGPTLRDLPAAWTDFQVYQWPACALLDGADNLDVFVNGGVGVGFVSGAQIDRHGNLNVTNLRVADKTVRLVGCLAVPEHQAFARRSIILADLSPRTFVEQVDYITGVGYLHGGRTREEAGLGSNGPQLVLTDKALFDFDATTRVMRVRALYPGVALDEVLSLLSFRPLIPDPIPQVDPPTAEQVRLMREIIDPARVLLAH